MADRSVTSPAARHSRRSTGYVVLGFLATFMPMPFNIVAVVPLVAAAVESALTLRAMRADGAPAPMRRWTGVSIGVTVVLIAMVAMPYLFWGSTRDYNECMSGANTAAAQSACKQNFAAPTGDVESYLIDH